MLTKYIILITVYLSKEKLCGFSRILDVYKQ